MKTIWKCVWETIPGDGEHTQKYTSFAKAKEDIRKMICEINIDACTSALRRGVNAKYRSTIANFLKKYFSDADFPISDKNIPSDDEELDDCEISISPEYISFSYYGGEYPHLDTNMVMMQDKNEEYEFTFYFDEPQQTSTCRITELTIRLTPIPSWGTSAYPLLILDILRHSCEPMTQNDIAYAIEQTYDTRIERKAISRNIALLKALRYNIKCSNKGYYIPK